MTGGFCRDEVNPVQIRWTSSEQCWELITEASWRSRAALLHVVAQPRPASGVCVVRQIKQTTFPQTCNHGNRAQQRWRLLYDVWQMRNFVDYRATIKYLIKPRNIFMKRLKWNPPAAEVNAGSDLHLRRLVSSCYSCNLQSARLLLLDE